MKKFKVGERVECVYDDSRNVEKGEKGIVVESGLVVKVRWDTPKTGRHGCGGLCETNRGWNLLEKKLTRYNNLESTIGKALKNRGFSKAYRNAVIPHLEDAYFQQNDKLCFLRTRKGVGYAMRNPEDTHDADLAICLCVERVFGVENREYKVGDKVSFVDEGSYGDDADYLFPNGYKNHTGTITRMFDKDFLEVKVSDSKYLHPISFFTSSLKLRG